MSKIFIHIYDWFENHIKTFYVILATLTIGFAIMASQISFQENIANFFDNDDQQKSAIFENLKIKDKIIVMINGDNPDLMMECADRFVDNIKPLHNEGLIRSITHHIDIEVLEKYTHFVYSHLPIFLDSTYFEEMTNRLDATGIETSVKNTYNILVSPSGMVMSQLMLTDPLNIGTHMLKKFEKFGSTGNYEIYNGALFTKDLHTMLLFIEPEYGMGDTGNNDRLVAALEKAQLAAESNGVNINSIGGPIVAVHNARQIKRDTAITMSLALIIILTTIFFSFRNRKSIPFIIIPPAFGVLFSLAMVWIIKGEISGIAIGAGTVIIGISLSYSIHIISHLNHISSPRLIIHDLATPLTIGSITTIGAFAALLFTSSTILQDMGLFSVFSLIGTTLFSLIFLPHFLKGFDNKSSSRLLNYIERLNNYNYEQNKWLVALIAVTAIISLFFYNDVQFDDNMSNINFVPTNILDAEKASENIFGNGSNEVFVVSAANDITSLAQNYKRLENHLNILQQKKQIDNNITISDFLISPDEQTKRINRWNKFWTEHKDEVISNLDKAATKTGFKPEAFDYFKQLINNQFTPFNYSDSALSQIPVISEWISSSNGTYSVLSKINIKKENKEAVYRNLSDLYNVIVADRAFFSSKMVEQTNNDFNYILLISSAIVFIALFISYGRLELTILTFLPMLISWTIILGLMAIFNIKFNIVNIILATFIFGIGDDFSIFIMDGLLEEYKTGKRLLATHKSAIFFSAFTAIIGMGVLVFAKHPALKSIALISVLGLSVVVLVSFTVQPLLFKLLVTNHTAKHRFPWTFAAILNSVYCFTYFLIACIIAQIYMIILIITPIKTATKKLSFHRLIYTLTRTFLDTMITVTPIRENIYDENFSRPAIIIANHQSFIDILLILSTTPKLVMVTNSWVQRSPFFGLIVKYADFYSAEDGYENIADSLQERMNDGYSIVIFPEGTRSPDCSIQHFHKGAFYLAELLKTDIIPIIIYGAGLASAKLRPFYIKKGYLVTRTLQRITPDNTQFGSSYQERTKNIRNWFKLQYNIICNDYNHKNPYFRDALIKNYIYKGPILEWYIRIKCRLDGYYSLWHSMIPPNASIVDVGCGFGQLDFMLNALSPNRKITAIDYDCHKIQIAANSFMTNENIKFRCADMRLFIFPPSDVILFNDSLHYVDINSQLEILKKAIKSLNTNGFIIIRDSDSSNENNHRRIKNIEHWSTKILKFNKTTQDLAFSDYKIISNFANENMLNITMQTDHNSAETTYILKQKE